jgi:DNA-binding response OmpR family regulator
MSLSSMIVSRDWQEVSVLECILSGLHIDVDVESHLDRAWSRLSKSKVDAVIVDCDENGTREFLRKLRTAPLGSAPVIIASGSPNQNRLRGTGATFVVEKPVSVERAVHTLSAARNLILGERLRYHRQSLDLPGSLKLSSGRRVKARVVNLSKTGTKIVSPQLLSFAETVLMRFSLPKVKSSIEVEGKVAWANSQGHAGIRFVQIAPHTGRRLQLWVEQKYFQRAH